MAGVPADRSDGVDIGEVRRTHDSGGDRMTPTERRSGWGIHGVTGIATREEAERRLIERAISFGKLTGG